MPEGSEGAESTRRTLRADVATGAVQVSPIVLSVFVYGLVLGALASQAGLSPLEVAVMSGLVFAGASQFVAVDLWSTPVAIGAVALATLLVNLRHTLMGAAIAPALRGVPPARAYGALFFLVDEAWALSLRRFAEGRFNLAYYLGLCVPLYAAWIASTAAGAALGGLVADPARFGLDVVFTAVFIMLLIGHRRGRDDLVPWAVSAAAAAALMVALLRGPMLLAVAASIAAAVAVRAVL